MIIYWSIVLQIVRYGLNRIIYDQQSKQQYLYIYFCIIELQALIKLSQNMEALKALNKALRQNQSIKQLVSLLQKKSEIFVTRSPQQLASSQDLQFICTKFDQMKINQLESVFNKLPPIPQITAIIIKSSKYFTLAFLMIPQKKYFGWHDHSKMNGISKIVGGSLFIRSINPQHFQKCAEGQNIFLYPIDRIREQSLSTSGQKISIIYPDSFNIHQIFAEKQSSFLDLLIPQYPDNSCHYFKTCQQPIIQGEQQDKIKIKKIEKSYQQIIGIQALAKWFSKSQKKQKEKHKQNK